MNCASILSCSFCLDNLRLIEVTRVPAQLTWQLEVLHADRLELKKAVSIDEFFLDACMLPLGRESKLKVSNVEPSQPDAQSNARRGLPVTSGLTVPFYQRVVGNHRETRISRNVSKKEKF